MKPLLILFLILSSICTMANIRLPAVISDGMVLQRNSRVPLWGWCEPGEKITIRTNWDTTSYSANGDAQARWVALINTPEAGGPYTIELKGYNTVLIQDVLIGEVWVCSGQSNMEWSVNWGLPYEAEAVRAANDQLRFFHVPRTAADFPQDDLKAVWVHSSAETMKRFSAVAYFFGKKLHEKLGVPIGLIHASWGGTPAEVWTPADIVMKDPGLKEAASKLQPSAWWPTGPGASYNAMIHPLVRFHIAGVIWYQGESNVGTAATYTSLFTKMIRAWRMAWQKELPFYFAQIAPYAGYGDNSSSAFLREAQTKTLSLSNTGMVLTSDLVDDINDIHPKRKKEVGERLANLALHQTYGRWEGPYQSPLFESMQVEKNLVRIRFANAEKGLVAKGPLTEFHIAGEDRVFVPAEARVEGNTVVVWSKKISKPLAVRYGFRNAAQAQLFSSEGIPVNLFRTDDWPVDIVTGQK